MAGARQVAQLAPTIQSTGLPTIQSTNKSPGDPPCGLPTIQSTNNLNQQSGQPIGQPLLPPQGLKLEDPRLLLNPLQQPQQQPQQPAVGVSNAVAQELLTALRRNGAQSAAAGPSAGFDANALESALSAAVSSAVTETTRALASNPTTTNNSEEVDALKKKVYDADLKAAKAEVRRSLHSVAHHSVVSSCHTHLGDSQPCASHRELRMHWRKMLRSCSASQNWREPRGMRRR